MLSKSFTAKVRKLNKQIKDNPDCECVAYDATCSHCTAKACLESTLLKSAGAIATAFEHDALTIDKLALVSAERSARWHPTPNQEFNLFEMCGAMAGEAGECLNAGKKHRRIQLSLINKSDHPLTDFVTAEAAIAKEAADTILYAVLVIQQAGHDVGETLRRVFNEKSIECGFPERL